MSAPDPRDPGPCARARRMLPVAILLAIAAVVRLAAFSALPPERLVGDEIYYAQVARSLALGEGHRFREDGHTELRAWRPPAHPFALSLFLDSAAARAIDDQARNARPLLMMQIALGTALVAAIWLLAQVLFGGRAALLAGCAAALYPTLVSFSHMLWSETMTALLFALALAAAAHWRRAPTPGLAAALGLVLGVATLTRELAFALALVLAAWWNRFGS